MNALLPKLCLVGMLLLAMGGVKGRVLLGEEQGPALSRDLPPLSAPSRDLRPLPAPPYEPATPNQPAPDVSLGPSPQRTTPSGPHVPNLEDVPGGMPLWSTLIRGVVLDALPRDYENRKHWGMTKTVFAGVNVRNDGLKVRISKKTSEVRHGNWRRYRIEIPDPDRNFFFEIQKIESPEPGLYTFQIVVVCRSRITSHYENWTLGVKGINLSTVANATLRARLFCQLRLRHERVSGRIFPDLVIEPEVSRARVALTGLDVHHIGKIGGDLAELMGNSSRWMVEDIVQGQEDRIVKKANKAITKNKEKLRLSTGKLW
ncbi:MAG: hypothetical protein R3C01_06140 [Planctomycetaceae bacterium]